MTKSDLDQTADGKKYANVKDRKSFFEQQVDQKRAHGKPLMQTKNTVEQTVTITSKENH